MAGALERVAVVEPRFGPEQFVMELADPLVQLGHRELADRALGPRRAPLAVLRGADVGESLHLGADPQLHETVPQHRVGAAALPRPHGAPMRPLPWRDAARRSTPARS